MGIRPSQKITQTDGRKGFSRTYTSFDSEGFRQQTFLSSGVRVRETPSGEPNAESCLIVRERPDVAAAKGHPGHAV